MGRPSVVVVAVLVATVLLGSVAVPAAHDHAGATAAIDDDRALSPAQTGATGVTADLERPDPRSVIGISVSRTGDATVAVESRFLVNESDDDETAAFETLYEQARDGEADLLYSEATFEALVEDVADSTGREMAVEDAEWTRSVSNGTGTLTFRFTWTNFAIDREETIIVGDGFRTEDGPWLPTLLDGQRLVVQAPTDYAVLSPSYRVGQDRIVWDGPYDFGPGSPSVTFGEQGTDPGTTTTWTPTTAGTPGTTTANGTGGPGSDGSALFWLGLLILVLSVGGGGYWYFAEAESPSDGTDDTPTVAGESGATDEASAASPTEAESAAAAATAGGVAEATTEEEVTDEDEDTDDGVDPELLSDEERVEYLLEQNGGRMKQARIVKETGWSNAKVSQLLSAMDDDERVDKLRIGRENLITLPDEDVTDF